MVPVPPKIPAIAVDMLVVMALVHEYRVG